jgi:hypothetical protein
VSRSAEPLVKLAAVAALLAVAAAGAVSFYRNDETAGGEVARPGLASPSPSPSSSPSPLARRQASQPVTLATRSATLDDDDMPTRSQLDAVARLLGRARHLARDGRLQQARAALDEAAALLPGSLEIAEARRDVERLASPSYRLAVQLDRARLAIAHNDWPAARRALGAAESIDAQAAPVVTLRQTLQQSVAQEADRKRRIAALLGTMRQAIARHDLAAADRALNEAERLDVRAPAIAEARLELARAQDARTAEQ